LSKDRHTNSRHAGSRARAHCSLLGHCAVQLSTELRHHPYCVIT
jgi:hypothetical protein